MRRALMVLMLTACGRVDFDVVRADARDDTAIDPDARLPDVTAGLVGWWKLDEGAGTMVFDSIGAVNGTFSAGMFGGWRTNGAIGGAAFFDGVTSRVDFGTSRIDLPGPMTACAWVNVTDIPNNFDAMVVRACDPTDCQYSLEVEMTLTTALYWDNGGAIRVTSVSSVLAPAVWQHMCGVRRSSTDAALYVDGQPVAVTIVPGPISPTPAHLWIGTNQGTGSFFHGALDDVRLYDRALSDAEVAQLYAHVVGP